MTCISTFLVNMDHEFPDFNHIKISRCGYKVDGQGIKNCCKLNNLKSVDYFEVHEKHGLLLVEFSDLLRQRVQIDNMIQSIKSSNIPKKEKTDLVKEQYKKFTKN